MWSLINISNNLHTTDELTGLEFSDFLNNGVTFTSFRSDGTIPS